MKEVLQKKSRIADTVLKIISEGTTVIYIAKAFDDYAATYITPSIEKQLGYTPEEFLSYPEFWTNHIHPDDRTKVLKGLSPLFENNHHTHEYRFQHKDGSYRWMHDKLTLLRSNDGSPLEIVGHWTEVTERKLRELDANNALSQLNATLDATTDGILVVNDSGIIQAYNEKFVELWQIPKDVLAKKSDKAALTFVLSQLNNPEKFISKVESLYSTPEAESFDTLIFKDGRVFERYSRPQKIKEQVIGRVWSFRDVTERENVECQLKDAKDKSEAASKAKSEFLSSMSHELRTPMNSILGFAQLLELDKETLSENQNASVQYILGGGHHLLNLINEVLDLAQIESGKYECDIKDIPLKEIINECSTLINNIAEKSNIKIDYGNPQDYIIMADPNRIKQVLINYLSNAIKYNRPNGRVTIKYQTVDDNRLRINVSDTGEGINENDIAMLFNPFTRVGDKSSNIEGTGIGLAISKELMTLMDGAIGVSSIVGEGSTFWFEIKLGK